MIRPYVRIAVTGVGESFNIGPDVDVLLASRSGSAFSEVRCAATTCTSRRDMSKSPSRSLLQ